MTMKIYGDINSGNCYKLKLLCVLEDIPHEWIHVDILKGETHTPAFLAINPNGKIPAVVLDDDRCLSESNAILHYLAAGTRLQPTDAWQHAQVLQWQFFEQYSHEPYIAVARYIAFYLGLPEARRAEYEAKQAGGRKALQIMETQLGKTAFLVGEQFSLADISLYAYTHVAGEGGFNLDDYPAVQGWISRIQAMPGYIGMK